MIKLHHTMNASDVHDFVQGKHGNWSAITASDPMNKTKSSDWNVKANQSLENDLRNSGMDYIKTTRKFGGPESTSFIIYGKNHGFDKVNELAKKYDQQSAFHSKGGTNTIFDLHGGEHEQGQGYQLGQHVQDFYMNIGGHRVSTNVGDLKLRGDDVMEKSLKDKHPFRVGDKVRLHPEAFQQHARSVPAHAGYSREQFSWRDTLQDIGNSNAIGTVSRIFPNSQHVNVDFGEHKIGINASSLVPYSEEAKKAEDVFIEEFEKALSESDINKADNWKRHDKLAQKIFSQHVQGKNMMTPHVDAVMWAPGGNHIVELSHGDGMSHNTVYGTTVLEHQGYDPAGKDLGWKQSSAKSKGSFSSKEEAYSHIASLGSPSVEKAWSQEKIGNKIGKLVDEGYPQKQAVAIAYNMSREASKKSEMEKGFLNWDDSPIKKGTMDDKSAALGSDTHHLHHPVHGWQSMQDIKTAHRDIGGEFFSPSKVSFFNTKVLTDKPHAGKYFIVSEGRNEGTSYHVWEAKPSGHIEPDGSPISFKTYDEAKTHMKTLK